MSRRTAEEKAAARERVVADRDTVIDRYTRGESLRAIARIYDVHAPWLSARLTRWGVEVRAHNAPPTAHTHVHRDGETGAVTAIRCPDPRCGRVADVSRNRLNDHLATTTGTRCALSGSHVQDKAPNRNT
ncbi:hypothetical protein GCM10010387_19520 [Streptomyces inusitatus]|uniref:Uncharacterized protein n=1 Tax=Streptomyces inusitatus TaxID=68221 RepID=A0A918PX99_9ACTN|nr:hypothetical protein GCM10010387_19520 [Streptomyces inusitatus]